MTSTIATSCLSFDHRSTAVMVHFGRGRFEGLGSVLEAAGLSQPLVISTPDQAPLASHAAELLGGRCVGVHAEAVVHVPAPVAARGRDEGRSQGARSLVAVGGGSAIGLAKAITLEQGLPIVAVPTTFAGSEMTAVWGMTSDGHKQTGRDERVRPGTVVYDPALTDSLPPAFAVASGINALAHAAEAMWAPDRSPITSLLAREGAGALAAALAGWSATGSQDPALADRALYGAWLCGSCLGSTTMGVHHALCHAVAGTLDLPHAQTHTVMLPVVLELQRERWPTIVKALAAALSVDAAAALIRDLATTAGLPTTLRELGMRDEDIDPVADNVHLTPEQGWTHDDAVHALRLALG